MEDSNCYNPDWWREEKALSLASRSAASAAKSGVRLGDSFLIVTEGKLTEPVYFRLLRDDMQLSVVHVHIEPGHGTDPRQVIDTAHGIANARRKMARKAEIGYTQTGSFDHVWAVLDTDVAARKKEWPLVEAFAAKKKVNVAQSTPCFEFWLILHLLYTTRSDLLDGDCAKDALKELVGHDCSTDEDLTRHVISSFVTRWPHALRHAATVRKHHIAAGSSKPSNPSTDVDRLVAALNFSAPKHIQARAEKDI